MPIIPMWMIWLVSILDSMRGCLIAVIVIVCSAALFGTLFYLMDDMGDEGDRKTLYAWLRKAVIAVVVSLIFFILIPSTKTGILMVASRYATAENINAITNYVELLVEKAED